MTLMVIPRQLPRAVSAYVRIEAQVAKAHKISLRLSGKVPNIGSYLSVGSRDVRKIGTLFIVHRPGRPIGTLLMFSQGPLDAFSV